MSGAVGKAVRRLRRERGWSAQRLADECARLGAPTLTRGTIAKIESGVRKTVTTDELVDLAKAFGVDAAALLPPGPNRAPLPPADADKWARPGGPPSVSVRSARTIANNLARLNLAGLERPLFYSEADSVVPPRIAEIWQPPRVRLAKVTADSALNDETWWATQPMREDLEAIVDDHVASPAAAEAPLLILGHPGAGKTILTQVLAARLSKADFVCIRVPLRNIPANLPIMHQVEYALRDQLAESVSWGSFARSIKDVVPVLFLDGLDELLTSRGPNYSDYLKSVVEFQRRESDLGRPVAIVVTTRLTAIDRMATPIGATAIRLEPFDHDQIRTWITTWNTANERVFAARELQPLSTDVISTHLDLAEQPLLLLQLALFHMESDASTDLTPAELYESLLTRFTRREVEKQPHGGPESDSDDLLEKHLARLSVAAIGMFNRGMHQIHEKDLARDLATLGLTDPEAQRRPRQLVGTASLPINDFFFVHQPAHVSIGQIERTYVFLHTSFAEYLTARFTVQVLHEIAEFRRFRRVTSSTTDDDFLYALLSFCALSEQKPILQLVAETASAVPAEHRASLVDLVLDLFRAAPWRSRDDRFNAYEPRPLPNPARYAIYRVNLVLVLACIAGEVRLEDLFAHGAESAELWRREMLLWQSQLDQTAWRNLKNVLCEHTDEGSLHLRFGHGSAPTLHEQGSS